MKKVINNFAIRSATLDDLETLVKFRIAILLELDILRNDDIPLMEPKFGDYIKSKLLSGELLCWFIEVNGKIAGVGKVMIYDAPPQSPQNPGKECYIFGVYIIPDMRGLGLATQITKHIINELKASNYKNIWLRASKFGKTIYEKLGFVSSGSHSCEYMELKQ